MLPAVLPFMTRIADAAAIVLAGWLALHLRRLMDLPFSLPPDLTWYWAMIVLGALLNTLFSGSVHRSWRGADLPQMLGRVVGKWLLVQALLLLGLFVFKTTQDVSRIWFVVWGASSILALVVSRLMIYAGLRSLRKRGYNQKRVVLVGEGPLAEELQQRVIKAGWSGYVIESVIAQPAAESLERLATSTVDEVWLALPLGNESVLREVLYVLRHSTAVIRFVPDLFTLRLINHGVSEVLGLSMYDLAASPMVGMNQVVKWVEDKVVASVLLLLLSPLMLVIALGVKITSPGPVFFRQARHGLGGRPIYVLKFRSMVAHEEQPGQVTQATRGDARITPLGAFLRKTSLDELPQFFNVLMGDMSVVGPRPHALAHNEHYKNLVQDYMQRHRVKPGITGWAQVNGFRGETDTLDKMQQRVEYDLYYIENWSLWLDLKIILLTAFKGFVNKNAY